jgi:NAD(P)-dependent dehydrogenase (short-subunit alcohol dehydrogenase family)
MITSQGGSIAWRTTQNPNGHDYGHHMSKAAANMMSVLLAQELKSKGVAVFILHPGFNKTDMVRSHSCSSRFRLF